MPTKKKPKLSDKFTDDGFVATLKKIRRDLDDKERDPNDTAYRTSPDYSQYLRRDDQ
jgi:hypothetical protein